MMRAYNNVITGLSLLMTTDSGDENVIHVMRSFRNHGRDGIERVVHYRKGKVQGRIVLYHSNGKLANESWYNNGLRHGLGVYYDSDGDILEIDWYEHGRKMTSVERCSTMYMLSVDNKLSKVDITEGALVALVSHCKASGAKLTPALIGAFGREN